MAAFFSSTDTSKSPAAPRRAAHAYLALVCVGMQFKALGTVIVELEPCGQVDRGKHISVELSQRLQLELRWNGSEALDG